MTCPNCIQAESRAEWPGYTASCRACMARGIANGPEFHRARADGTLTPSYTSALYSIWGEDWKAGHTEVKAWAERLRQAREVVV